MTADGFYTTIGGVDVYVRQLVVGHRLAFAMTVENYRRTRAVSDPDSIDLGLLAAGAPVPLVLNVTAIAAAKHSGHLPRSGP